MNVGNIIEMVLSITLNSLIYIFLFYVCVTSVTELVYLISNAVTSKKKGKQRNG